jgi:hypothetical protein
MGGREAASPLPEGADRGSYGAPPVPVLCCVVTEVRGSSVLEGAEQDEGLMELEDGCLEAVHLADDGLG